MSMWPEVVFWYLLVGVILAIGISTVLYQRRGHLTVWYWVCALLFVPLWLPGVIWMMWEDRK